MRSSLGKKLGAPLPWSVRKNMVFFTPRLEGTVRTRYINHSIMTSRFFCKILNIAFLCAHFLMNIYLMNAGSLRAY